MNSPLSGNLLLVAFLLCSPPARAQFEGVVESRNITTDEMGNPQAFLMTMWVKDGMVRIHTIGEGIPSTTMIYRNDRQVIWMLNDEEKIYFEINQKEEPQEIRPPQSTTEDRHSVRRTGKTRKILGYNCEQLLITRGTERTELWGTKHLGKLSASLEKALGEDAKVGESWTDEIRKMGLYPLKSSTRIDGNLVESQEVTRIKEEKLEDGLFIVPTEYSRQTFEQMLDGMAPREE